MSAVWVCKVVSLCTIYNFSQTIQTMTQQGTRKATHNYGNKNITAIIWGKVSNRQKLVTNWNTVNKILSSSRSRSRSCSHSRSIFINHCQNQQAEKLKSRELKLMKDDEGWWWMMKDDEGWWLWGLWGSMIDSERLGGVLISD